MCRQCEEKCGSGMDVHGGINVVEEKEQHGILCKENSVWHWHCSQQVCREQYGSVICVYYGIIGVKCGGIIGMKTLVFMMA